ncbi:MAG: hypothetical protein IPP35_09235 [Elusimicrobia bacterium]|nr:hypothetical protein [Elusimicrobiota bacterium]
MGASIDSDGSDPFLLLLKKRQEAVTDRQRWRAHLNRAFAKGMNAVPPLTPHGVLT